MADVDEEIVPLKMETKESEDVIEYTKPNMLDHRISDVPDR